MIPTLFTAFKQVDSSISRKYGGSGLGLVISERLVRLLKGKIKVESVPNQCSTFTFSIQCKQASNIVEEQEYSNQGKAILDQDFAITCPFKILVAEDNLMNQKLILKVLDKLGYTPDLANDGTEVLRMIENTNYDLIFMDIQMPNLDGLETTRIIRKTHGKKHLILAMTANALTEDRINCFKAGMDAYLSKPLNFDALVGTLRNMHRNGY